MLSVKTADSVWMCRTIFVQLLPRWSVSLRHHLSRYVVGNIRINN